MSKCPVPVFTPLESLANSWIERTRVQDLIGLVIVALWGTIAEAGPSADIERFGDERLA